MSSFAERTDAAARRTYRNEEAPFDRILVPDGRTEFRYATRYVLVPGDSGVHFGKLSDHYLVLTAIRVLADDD